MQSIEVIFSTNQQSNTDILSSTGHEKRLFIFAEKWLLRRIFVLSYLSIWFCHSTATVLSRIDLVKIFFFVRWSLVGEMVITNVNWNIDEVFVYLIFYVSYFCLNSDLTYSDILWKSQKFQFVSIDSSIEKNVSDHLKCLTSNWNDTLQ